MHIQVKPFVLCVLSSYKRVAKFPKKKVNILESMFHKREESKALSDTFYGGEVLSSTQEKAYLRVRTL